MTIGLLHIVSQPTPNWAPIKLGNGGIIKSIDIANDGTMVSSTDSFGGYVWSPTKNQWVQLLTTSAMPASLVTTFLSGSEAFATGGFDDIFIDKVNSNSIWIVYHGRVFHSVDKGNTFTQVTGWPQQDNNLCSDNGNAREYAPYSAVDPNNSNIIYIGTSSQGLYRSVDGGTTWNRVTAVATGLPVALPVTTAQVGTDTSNITMALGPQTFGANSSNFGLVVFGSTPAANKLVVVYETSNNNNAMCGYVTAINSSTSFTMNVVAMFGSGTHSDWTVYPAPPQYNTPHAQGGDTSNITPATGTVAFNNNSGSFGFSIGDFVKVWSKSDPSKQMFGSVTASSGTTFSLNVTVASGAAASDWNVSPALNQNNNQVGGGHRIVFDLSGSTVSAALDGHAAQTVTKNVFVHTYGVNTFKSTDGGVTWPLTNQTTPRPNCIYQMRCDAAGTLWVVDDDGIGFTNNFDKLVGAVWTNQIATPIAGAIVFTGLAVDPTTTPNAIVAIAGSSFNVAKSVDGGGTWSQSGGAGAGNVSYAIGPGDPSWVGTWYAYNPANISGTTCAMFDPVVSGKVWMGTEGVGYFFPPASGTLTFTFTTQTRGIEEFINNRIVAPPGLNGVFMLTWDFPLFFSNNFNNYPSVITGPGGPAGGLTRGFAMDWCWNSPSTIVVLIEDGTGLSNNASVNYSGITTTGGANQAAWTRFSDYTTITAGQAGSDIAISDASHIVVVPTNSAYVPKVTINGGTSWSPITVGGGSAPSGDWGAIANSATYTKTIESDKANGNMFLFNVNINNVSGIGFYKSVNKGVDWTLKSQPTTFTGQSNYNEQMKSSGVADCLFFTPGQQGGPFPVNSGWYWTTDGCTTWSQVANFKQVITFGFGAIFAGQSFPSIYAAGWYNSGSGDVYGIWMCKNFNPATGAGTWTQIGDQLPMGTMSWPCDIDGDKVTAGKVYMTTNGGGAYWGQFS